MESGDAFENTHTTETADGISVQKLKRANVADTLAAFPAAIDNQWAPRSILNDIVQHGVLPKDWGPKRDRKARAEVMRSLIDNERIIINRAYIFNSSALKEEYLEKRETRDDFQKLLESSAIVVNLVNEESPTQIPSFPIENREEVEKSWVSLCKQSSSIPILRMSWDDEENREDFKKYIEKPFAARLLALGALDWKRSCSDLGLEKNSWLSLQKSMGLLVEHVNREKNFEGRSVTRNEIYQKFVIREGGSVASREYQGDPMRLAIKEFADLVYNTNSAEAYRVLSSSPDETLNRSALQEFNDEKPDGHDMDPDELARCFRQTALDVLRQGYSINRLDLLNSSDIVRIRNSIAYKNYIDYLRAFLGFSHSETFGALVPPGSNGTPSAQGLLQAYETLVSSMERHRDGREREKWQSNLTFRIETAGFSIEVDALLAKIKVDGISLLKKPWNKSVPYTVKCVLGSKKFMAQALGSSFEMFRGHMSNPSEQLTQLHSRLKEYTKFEMIYDDEIINEAASSRSEDMSNFDLMV
ncbi:MAG: hypothetical protein AAGB13_11720 [Cyanobacteria bacterium P01_F01_bin.33]